MLPYLDNDFLIATTRLDSFRKNIFFNCLSFYFIGVLGVFFFLLKKWLHFCIPHQFKISFVLIVLAFTLLVTFQGMSKVLTLLLASFPKLTKLFLFLQISSPLLLLPNSIPLVLGVGFRFNLAPFWGCLNLVLRALICFIGSFEPSTMRSGKLFNYHLTKLTN